MTYIINTDNVARNRLNLQNEMYEQSSINQISRAGSLSGKRVLEVGCGTGAMTLHLARAVGPRGSVTAIDNNQSQLDASREFLEDNGIHNVTFSRTSVDCLSSLAEPFDFVYCRMVLHHLADADRAIREMIKVIRPMGYLLLP
jgi:ubiquinone/menaquinone biosynthesis C-methylase UbiE